MEKSKLRHIIIELFKTNDKEKYLKSSQKENINGQNKIRMRGELATGNNAKPEQHIKSTGRRA